MYQNEPSARRRAQRPSRRGLPPGLALFPASVLLFVVSLILLGSSLVSGGKDGRAPIAVRQSAPAQTTAPQLAASPAQDEEDWRLRLVNPWNPLPEDYTVKTITLDNGARVDERCYPDLQAMMDDCRAAGNSPMICSAYRDWDTQEKLFQDQVDGLLAQGYSQEEAEKEAGTVVAVPGTSEHQLGLALDIVDADNQLLDESQENTAVQKWLMEHSWEYGFILRYPNDKSEITGIIYEPWHYRYVGKEDAEKIHSQGVCLEEYLQSGRKS